MRYKTKSVALTAILAALSVLFIFLGGVFPSGQLGFAAAACLFGVAAVIEAGIVYGVMLYVVSAALALVIVPYKLPAILYAAFFGYYPVVKSAAERMKERPLEWVIKLAVMNAALTGLLLTVKSVFVPDVIASLPNAIIYVVFNVVFIIFDIGVSRLIALYMSRVSKHLK
ncbi:MAG: hypothetical protein IJ072_03015 [Oscillospiraceae bacterium]|nr:hypothetical protein [Oscillospiraceae bacterium]